eukprot:1953689-Pyramimonas_sp.AAC.1
MGGCASTFGLGSRHPRRHRDWPLQHSGRTPEEPALPYAPLHRRALPLPTRLLEEPLLADVGDHDQGHRPPMCRQ